MESRNEYLNIFVRIVERKELSIRILYSEKKYSSWMLSEIRTFSYERKLSEFVSRRSVPQELLKFPKRREYIGKKLAIDAIRGEQEKL